MNEDLHALVDMDRLVHEPARLIILTILNAVEKADFLYLLRETGLTRGNLSSHLTKLEEANYIKIEKSFRGKVPQTLISITDLGRDSFTIYREKLNMLVERMNKE